MIVALFGAGVAWNSIPTVLAFVTTFDALPIIDYLPPLDATMADEARELKVDDVWQKMKEMSASVKTALDYNQAQRYAFAMQTIRPFEYGSPPVVGIPVHFLNALGAKRMHTLRLAVRCTCICGKVEESETCPREFSRCSVCGTSYCCTACHKADAENHRKHCSEKLYAPFWGKQGEWKIAHQAIKRDKWLEEFVNKHVTDDKDGNVHTKLTDEDFSRADVPIWLAIERAGYVFRTKSEIAKYPPELVREEIKKSQRHVGMVLMSDVVSSGFPLRKP
jgi:hypothetical protein